MRASRLDRTITLQEHTAVSDGHGGFDYTWSTVAVVPAQLVEAKTAEFMTRAGAVEDDDRRAFRIRWRDGVNTSLRVIYQGETLNIVEIAELGRRDGLELRCTSIGAE